MGNLSNFVKRIRDIMRNDAGINGDAQRIEQLAWMLFLKVYRFKPLILEFSPLFSCFHRITVNPNSLSGCYLITPTWPASLDSPWIRLHKGTGEGDGRRYQWFSCPSLPWNFTTAVKAKPLTRLPAMSSAKWLT
mgnify:CR=1 FL=1